MGPSDTRNSMQFTNRPRAGGKTFNLIGLLLGARTPTVLLPAAARRDARKKHLRVHHSYDTARTPRALRAAKRRRRTANKIARRMRSLQRAHG